MAALFSDFLTRPRADPTIFFFFFFPKSPTSTMIVGHNTKWACAALSPGRLIRRRSKENREKGYQPRERARRLRIFWRQHPVKNKREFKRAPDSGTRVEFKGLGNGRGALNGN